MDPAWAALAAVASPLILVGVNRYFDRGAKREDWKRQDEVAKRAEAAADRVTARSEAAAVKVAETADLLLAENERVATTTKESVAEMRGRLNQIHVLVNSGLTESERRVLTTTEALLARTRENVELKRAAGIEATVNDEDGLLELEMRIDGMTRGLEARAVQTEIADEQRAKS